MAEKYPTIETVRMVVTCMSEMGKQSEDTLFTCSCKHDVLESQLTFQEYEDGNIMERYKRMPGKKGGFFRDNEYGDKSLKKLTAARKLADDRCPTVTHIEVKRDKDKKIIEKDYKVTKD